MRTNNKQMPCVGLQILVYQAQMVNECAYIQGDRFDNFRRESIKKTEQNFQN